MAMGDLEILEEKLMAELPRGDERLRVTYTKARTGDGKEVAWHSIRLYYQDDGGNWRPGKQGITIRGRELGTVTAALVKASSGGAQPRPRSRGFQPKMPTPGRPGEMTDDELDSKF